MIRIWSFKPIVYTQTRIDRRKQDFERQTDHSILDRSSDLVLINKKKRIFSLVNFALPVDNRENKRKDRQIRGYCYRDDKAVKHEGESDTKNIGSQGVVSKGLAKKDWRNSKLAKASRQSRSQHS